VSIARSPLRRCVSDTAASGPAEQARIVQLFVERVDVQEDALEVRIRAEGLASLVGELRQEGESMAA
jgi:site-specific DNA recombinase